MSETDSSNLLWKKKSLPDIFEDIYKTAKSKDKQLTGLIAQLTGFVTDKESAANVIPLLKEYFELQIRNDDSVIKMARIAQLFLKDEKMGDLANNDLTALMAEADEIIKYQEEDEKKITVKLELNNSDEVTKYLDEGEN